MLNSIDKLVHDIEQANIKHNENMTEVIKTVLPDSGARSEFTTGAVRDASEGKGIPP